ncbi:hypothetical protein TNCV_804231 [Trichonephila clavipes]|nr:hypothetical protein TNCV_804231 [Trichonephila clavipes]
MTQQVLEWNSTSGQLVIHYYYQTQCVKLRTSLILQPRPRPLDLWKPHPDSFAFKISSKTSNCDNLIVTRKSVISTIARIFDYAWTNWICNNQGQNITPVFLAVET